MRTTEEIAVATQYASAIMQLASEQGQDKTVLDNLKYINAVVAQNPELEIVLKHPAVTPTEKKDLIISGFTGKVHELTMRLLELLTDKRRLNLLRAIEHEYQRLWRAKANIVAGTLTYAEKPDARILSEIKAKVQSQLGKQLELEEKEDRSLIGGYVLQLGDQVIDGSLKGRLQTIEKALMSV